MNYIISGLRVQKSQKKEYDNTIEFRRFAIYKNGKPIRVSHEIPLWYEKFIENVK